MAGCTDGRVHQQEEDLVNLAAVEVIISTETIVQR
jgi:hypothetical protein